MIKDSQEQNMQSQSSVEHANDILVKQLELNRRKNMIKDSQEQSIQTQFAVEHVNDILIKQIIFDINGHEHKIMQFWYSVEFKQIYAVFNYRLAADNHFCISYSGAAYTIGEGKQILNIPAPETSNPIIKQSQKIFFYQDGPAEDGNIIYAKTQPSEYIMLVNGAFFPYDGGKGSSSTAFVFAVYSRILQNFGVDGVQYRSFQASVNTLNITR